MPPTEVLGLAVIALAGPVMTAVSQDPVSLALTVPATVRAGDPVSLTLQLENHGGRPLDLYLRGRTTTFDVEVADSRGAVVWRRLEGEIIPAIVHLRTLAPGERVALTAAWDQKTGLGRPVPPGVYQVRGFLLTEGTPRETPPVPLAIRPR